ncbi:hypothetical protein CHLNCDRAFT_142251 [Chlorella variabilis]|uniref:Uncharacterized protein n=1 Tax=Chlorella variabilis TaxID=554065 RepID=E1Z847_CHLVA|nr:hypothetical protein CHLNCDRAFT_142251 [Chlorella variabilis]EFN58278.1 hypothetical protein CHLNCDRAFT_142251 [Chlorella variabilis]|eukprot:XP_005850380.1 hypothetical protein CHLNCDRAFT_142251 [Chlorella variabilis]
MSMGHRLRDFSPCELFARIRGRTLWLMGDSQAYNLYYALECFLREFAPSLRRTPPIPEADNQKLVTVHTPRPYAPVCLELAAATRVCTVRVDVVEHVRELLFPAFRKHLPHFKRDLVVFNFGLHYPWPGAGGEAFDASPLYQALVAHALWWDEQRAELPPMIWMDTPVQHFKSPSGVRPPNNTVPYNCTMLDAWLRKEPLAMAGGPYNAPLAGLIHYIADAHLQTWAATAPMWGTHLPGECSHWCHPSAYRLWMHLLNNMLHESRLGNAVRPALGKG